MLDLFPFTKYRISFRVIIWLCFAASLTKKHRKQMFCESLAVKALEEATPVFTTLYFIT